MAKTNRTAAPADRKVNIVIPQDTTFGRAIVQGVIAYARKHPRWRIAMYHGNPYIPWASLSESPCDGILAAAYSQAEVDELIAANVPVVNVSSAVFSRKFPTVRADNHRIGQLGAQHLIDKGLERFLFVGVSPQGNRRDGFHDALRAKGFACTDFFPVLDWSSNNLTTDGQFYTSVIKEQRYPVGIMGSDDRVAFGVLDACRLLGLHCPEQVAVIGCNNDQQLCRLAYTTLSSVDPAAEVIGLEAAEMLDQLMQGLTPPRLERLVPPRGVEARNSTDIRGIGDVHVSDAVRFIREHAAEVIDVNDVLNAIPLSRRALERRFGELIGHGIAEEIHRMHVDRAKELLKHTTLSLTQIALHSGYRGVSRFQANFQRIVGMSAATYRQKEADTSEETDESLDEEN